MANTAVVYDRNVNGKELSFEASGALLDASLVMRDRETDSWWSIMTSTSIGGDLNETRLSELPVGEKSTWKDWVGAHPDTVVLSIRGREHTKNNPYDNYFRSEDTFRGLVIEDTRLAPKESVFAFHLDDGAYAAAQGSFEGGRLFGLDGDRAVLLYREPGLSFFASSEAYLIEGSTSGVDSSELLKRARAGSAGTSPLSGFDTFWYSWVAVNEGSALLK